MNLFVIPFSLETEIDPEYIHYKVIHVWVLIFTVSCRVPQVRGSHPAICPCHTVDMRHAPLEMFLQSQVNEFLLIMFMN